MAVAMNDPKRIEALIRDLDAQKEAYFRTVQQAHEILAANLAGIVPTDPLKTESSPIDAPQDVTVPRSPPGSPSRTTSDREVATRNRKMSTGFTVETSSKSRSTGHDSDLDNDESYFVLEPLLPQAYDVEAMRSHIRGYRWDQYGKKVMDGVITSPARLSQASLIPSGTGRFEDRSDLAAVSVFDVGPDGSPLPVEFPNVEKQFGRAMAVWHTIKDVNPASKQRHAVGRITIMREPSPILFGAIHYTMNKYFCVDEFLHHLVSDAGSTANIRRAFEEDERKQRSFVFNFEYFTLIGKDCEPMKWQMAAGQEDRKPGHIQISRCSSTMGLYLAGPKIREVKNPSRKARKEKVRISLAKSPPVTVGQSLPSQTLCSVICFGITGERSHLLISDQETAKINSAQRSDAKTFANYTRRSLGRRVRSMVAMASPEYPMLFRLQIEDGCPRLLKALCQRSRGVYDNAAWRISRCETTLRRHHGRNLEARPSAVGVHVQCRHKR